MASWDIQYKGAVEYRAQVKKLTMREGIKVDGEQAKIEARFNLDNLTEEQVFTATALRAYPLLRYGLARFECKDTNGDWQTVELSEDVFLDLPEDLAEQCRQAILEQNPQRDMTIEDLKKMIGSILPAMSPDLLTSLKQLNKSTSEKS